MMKLKSCRYVVAARFMVLCATPAVESTLQAQAPVPVRVLATPDAVSSRTFGLIESARALNGGGVLVNDFERRRLVIVDSTLGQFKIALDSVAQRDTAPSYNGRPTLIPYLGDSTLLRDGKLKKYIVIDPNGAVAHTFDKKIGSSELLFMFPPRGFDASGNAIQTGLPDMRMSLARGVGKSIWHIMRANFATQTYDELVTIESESVGGIRSAPDSKGNPHTIHTVNPLAPGDEWVVMRDGALAVIRAKDYRVEFIGTDGKKRASTKIPFQKRKVTDDEKRALIDSARTALTSSQSFEVSRSNLFDKITKIGADSIRKMPRDETGKFQMPVASDVRRIEPEFAPIRDMASEYPPFRRGGAMPDADGNLWIATYAVSPTDANRTIYDVVNGNAELVQRVHVPAGRAVVGFARGGIVYLKFQRAPNEWVIERTHVVN